MAGDSEGKMSGAGEVVDCAAVLRNLTADLLPRSVELVIRAAKSTHKLVLLELEPIDGGWRGHDVHDVVYVLVRVGEFGLNLVEVDGPPPSQEPASAPAGRPPASRAAAPRPFLPASDRPPPGQAVWLQPSSRFQLTWLPAALLFAAAILSGLVTGGLTDSICFGWSVFLLGGVAVCSAHANWLRQHGQIQPNQSDRATYGLMIGVSCAGVLGLFITWWPILW